MIELIIEASIEDVHDKYYPNIELDIMIKLNQLSPDYNPSKSNRKTNYLPWLLKLYINKDAGLLFALSDENEFNRIKTILKRFEQIKSEIPNGENDINRYKSIMDLNKFAQKYKDYLTQKEKKGVIKSESDIVFDSDEWRIVIPRTWRASKFWGTNTKWCTASRDDDSWWNRYSKLGPLYINIDKRNNKKWQFFFDVGDGEFFDEEDERIDGNYWAYEDGYSIADICNFPEDVYDWYDKNIPYEKSYRLFEEIKVPWPGKDATFLFYSNSGCVYIANDGNDSFYLVEGYDEYDYRYILDKEVDKNPIICSDQHNFAFVSIVNDGYAFYDGYEIYSDIDEYENYVDGNVEYVIFIAVDNRKDDYKLYFLSNDYCDYVDSDVEKFSFLTNDIMLIKHYDDSYSLLDMHKKEFIEDKIYPTEDEYTEDFYLYDENGKKYVNYIREYFYGDWKSSEYKLCVDSEDGYEPEEVKAFSKVDEIKSKFIKTSYKLNETKKKYYNDRIN